MYQSVWLSEYLCKPNLGLLQQRPFHFHCSIGAICAHYFILSGQYFCFANFFLPTVAHEKKLTGLTQLHLLENVCQRPKIDSMTFLASNHLEVEDKNQMTFNGGGRDISWPLELQQHCENPK